MNIRLNEEQAQDRAQDRGRVVHCRRETAFDWYIGRNAEHFGFEARDANLGNPYLLGNTKDEAERLRVLARFEEHARKLIASDASYRARVLACHGKILGCWCAPKACHGDILLRLAAELSAAPASLLAHPEQP